MPRIFKDVTIGWAWTGDTEALKGFNVALCKDTETPTTASVVQAYVSDPTARDYIFKNVTLDTEVTYEPYVQAVYSTKDSDWVKTNGGSVSDDGVNTIPVKQDVDIAATTANWSAVSGIPYATVYSNDDSVALGFNPTFSDWTSTYPTGYQSSVGAAPEKETSIVRVGQYSVKYTCDGTARYMARYCRFGTSPFPAGTFLGGSIDIRMAGPAVTGKPGILVRLWTNPACTGSAYMYTKVQPPTSTLDVWQRVPWTARVNSNEQIYGIDLFVMGSWASFSTGLFIGTCYFDNLRFALFDSSIDNTVIRLNDDGTLSGGGASGAVSITGLGFTGDTNATYNDLTQFIGVAGNLMFNSNFRIPTPDGLRPAGALACYATSDPSVIRYYDAASGKTILKLTSSTDSSIGCSLPAFRVASGCTYTGTIKYRGSVAAPSGLYFRMIEADYELEPGITNLANSTTFETGCASGTRYRIMGKDNVAVTGDWEYFTFLYTPTNTAKWAGPLFLRYPGMYNMGSELHIANFSIASNSTVGAPPGTYVGNQLAENVATWSASGLSAYNAINDATAPALTTVALTNNIDGRAKLVITKPSDSDLVGYYVWRNTTNSTGTATLVYSAVHKDDTTIYDSCGTGTFYYWVSAYDWAGNESARIAPTPTSIAVTDTVVPIAPSTTVSGYGGLGCITTTWGPVAGINKYKVYGCNDTDFSSYDTYFTGTNSFTEYGRATKAARYYRIFSIGNNSIPSSGYITSAAMYPLVASDGTTPAVGTGVSVAVPTSANGNLKLTWLGSSSADAWHYRIIRHTCTSSGRAGDDGGFIVGMIDHVASGATHTFVDSGLQKGKYYWYSVYTIDNSGSVSSSSFQLPSSTAITAVDNTPPSVPSAPTLLSKIGAIAITWNAVTDAVKYNIYRCANASGTGEILSGSSVGVQFTDNSMDTNTVTSYYYRISAIDAWDNESAKSSFSSIGTSLTPTTANDRTAPTTVDAQITAVAASGGYNIVNWTDAAFVEAASGSGKRGYNVWRAENVSGSIGKTLLTTLGSKNIYSYNDTDVTGTVYYYVSCFDNAGNESTLPTYGWKSCVTSSGGTPSAPASGTVFGLTGQLEIRWPAWSGINFSRYETQEATSGTNWPADTTYDITTSEVLNKYNVAVTKTALANYRYRTRVVNTYGAKSAWVTHQAPNLTLYRPAAGSAPVNPTWAATGILADQNGIIKLAWIASTSTDVYKYRIYRSEDNTNFVAVNETVGLVYNDQGLLNTKTYYYIIRAVNSTEMESTGTLGTGSSLNAVAIDQVAPTAPAITVTPSLGALNLSWTEGSEQGTSYEVYRCNGASGSWVDGSAVKIASVRGTGVGYGRYIDNDPPVQTATTYTYALKVVDKWGNRSAAFGAKTQGTSLNNYVGLIGGSGASSIVSAITNFNTSNDQKSTTPALPTFSETPANILDWTSNPNGSIDVSFEWIYTAYTGSNGDQYDIDGFLIYVHNNGTSAPAAAVNLASSTTAIYTVDSAKRAIILTGLNPTSYYTFGVQAYRSVNTAISISGIKASAIAVPATGTTGEFTNGAWRADDSVNFSGDITGTIEGTDTGIVRNSALYGIPADSSNLIVDGEFENPTISDNWAGTCSRSTTTFFSGAGSLKIIGQASGGGNIDVYQFNKVENGPMYIPVEPGQKVYFEGRMYAGAAATCDIGWRTFGATKAASGWAWALTNSSLNTWEFKTGVMTVPAGVYYILPWARTRPYGGAGVTSYIDCFRMYKFSPGATVGAPSGTYVGAQLAEELVSDAAYAVTQADTANAELANIADDDLITPYEKQTVFRDWKAIYDEQAGITAQATALGITTEKTNYTTAYTTLQTYLNASPISMQNPPTDGTAWIASISNIAVSGLALRTNFANYYSNKQILLSKMIEYAAVNTMQLTPLCSGGVTMSIAGNTAIKTNATAGWNTSVYSRVSYVGGAYAAASIYQTNAPIMVGLSANPTGGYSYTNINYAMYARSDGTVTIYNLGSLVYTPGLSYAAGDTFAVVYDGVKVTYLKNGVDIWPAAPNVAAGQKLSFQAAFNTLNARIDNCAFGPMSSNDWSDIGGTGKPESNATVGADWTSNLDNVPLRFSEAPAGSGLYALADKFGFYNGGSWKTYMTNAGDFYLSGAGTHNLTWNSTAGTLAIRGSLNADDIAAGTLAAERLQVGQGAVGSGNLLGGKAVSGTGGVSTLPTDGSKAISPTYYSFGTGSSNNNAAESAYLEIDLASAYRIEEFRIYWYCTSSTRTYWYKIKYTPDGTNWYYAEGNPSASGWAISASPWSTTTGDIVPTVTRLAVPISARKIRVYGNGSTANTGNHIYEIEAYSKGTTVIDGAMIRTGTLNASLVNVTNINASNINAGTLSADLVNSSSFVAQSANIASGAVTNAKIGEYIASDNFNGSTSNPYSTPGASGWCISKNGQAAFSNIKVRGDVEATTLNAQAVNIVGTGHLSGDAITNEYVVTNQFTDGVNISATTWTTIATITVTPSGTELIAIAGSIEARAGNSNKVILCISKNNTSPIVTWGTIESGTYPTISYYTICTSEDDESILAANIRNTVSAYKAYTIEAIDIAESGIPVTYRVFAKRGGSTTYLGATKVILKEFKR